VYLLVTWGWLLLLVVNGLMLRVVGNYCSLGKLVVAAVVAARLLLHDVVVVQQYIADIWHDAFGLSVVVGRTIDGIVDRKDDKDNVDTSLDVLDKDTCALDTYEADTVHAIAYDVDEQRLVEQQHLQDELVEG
jgi:hypothetical protein